MITQNMIQSFFWAVSNYKKDNNKDIGCTVIDEDGNESEGLYYSRSNTPDCLKLSAVFFNIYNDYAYSTNSNFVEYGGSALGFGTGTKEAKISDYSLETPIMGDVFTPRKSSTVVSIRYPGSVVITQAFVYTGEPTITIAEVGLFSSVFPHQNATGLKRVLMAREVLENPITVSKGQQFVVTMTIN